MLEIHDLSIAFRRHDGGRNHPLQGLSLSLRRGEVAGLVGGSGAGKTLVAEALTGILPRNAEVTGRMAIDGAPPAPGRIAMAPQGIDALDPLERVGPQIRRFARLAGREVEVGELLSALGLPESAARAYPHELSGGMAKRALIGTALATGADFVIADEPTLGLDPDTADRIMALLKALSAKGRGILVISHDLRRLVDIATRVTILREGLAVETAPARAFATGGLRHPFSRALWDAQVWGAPC